MRVVDRASAATWGVPVKGGWTHVAEDLVSDLPFETPKARFDAKMHPLQYLRPQDTPTAGNIAQAAKMVAALGSAGALARRFARMSDVQALWMPRPEPDAKPQRAGVFAHLTPRANDSPSTSPAPHTVMTWVKFAASVLPVDEAIDFFVPAGKHAFMAMVTAVNADAPPIVQWDRADKRNSVSLCTYVGGSEAERWWNLRAREYRLVTAVVLGPWMWDEGRSFAHHGAAVCLVLEGARDLRYESGGGLFPEWLKSEYHGVRATLEAHFRSAVIEGKDQAEVCGISLNKGSAANLVVRVTSRGIRTDYQLDRWERATLRRGRPRRRSGAVRPPRRRGDPGEACRGRKRGERGLSRAATRTIAVGVPCGDGPEFWCCNETPGVLATLRAVHVIRKECR